MKNAKYFMILAAMAAMALFFPHTAKAEAVEAPMYRLYNPNSGEHFYTASAGERDAVVAAGWNDEGIGWYAPVTSKTPVYRLYNKNGGEHHYTMSKGEKDSLVKAGWTDEGIGWYSDDSKTVTLYRQYNPNAFANNHNYTTSKSENDHLVSLGWKEEGIGWYGVNKHEHVWVEEKVLVKEAWDEKVVTKEAWDEEKTVPAWDEEVVVEDEWDEDVYEVHTLCDACGFDFHGYDEEFVSAHMKKHALAGESTRRYSAQVKVGTIHHDAVTETVHHEETTETVHHEEESHIVHHEAEYKTVKKCSICGEEA